MGILRLFSYLSRKYPNIVHNYKLNREARFDEVKQSNETFVRNCEIVLIDSNAIFHPCCQKVFDYGNSDEKKSFYWTNKKKEMSYEQLEQMAFNMICNKINQIVEVSNPSKCVYIAIDGVPGLSKQAQQRQRRFKSIKTHSSNAYGFNPNVITTGTEFMERLCSHVHRWIYKKKKYEWKNLKVVYNNMFVPGEGEHKIIRFLEDNPHFKNITIMSPDADLIMLGLTLTNTPKGEIRKVTILRENVFDYIRADYVFVDINALKTYIVHDIRCENLNDLFVEDKAIRDYVFFSFMIGNDFLPNIPSLEISNKGIETLYHAYTTTYIENGYLLKDTQESTRNHKIYISKKAFIGLMKELASLEIKMIMDKWEKGYAKYPDKVLNRHIIRNKEIVLDFKEYRKDYYKTKFHLDDLNPANFEHEISIIARDYMVGMIFILRYYFKGIPTFDWCYQYHYAPFFSDIYNMANELALEDTNDFFDIKFNPVRPLSIYESLIGIFPPSSFNLIPNNISEKITEKIVLDSDFIEDFEIDLDGKQQDYEGICLLPFVTYDKIKKIFKNVELTQEQKEKNEIGKVYVI